jgi:hypothetical protein
MFVSHDRAKKPNLESDLRIFHEGWGVCSKALGGGGGGGGVWGESLRYF